MGNMTMIAVLLAGMLIIFVHSQRKFRTKLLCIFHTQDGMTIRKWLPMDARHVKFRRGSKGDVGRYIVNPKYFSNTLWDTGINMLFPILVPTIEFYWFNPNPVDQRAVQRYDPEKDRILPAIGWHTPEVRNAAWQEHQYRAFAEATVAQGGGGPAKQTMLQKIVPLAALGLGMIAIGILWQQGLIGG